MRIFTCWKSVRKDTGTSAARLSTRSCPPHDVRTFHGQRGRRCGQAKPFSQRHRKRSALLGWHGLFVNSGLQHIHKPVAVASTVSRNGRAMPVRFSNRISCVNATELGSPPRRGSHTGAHTFSSNHSKTGQSPLHFMNWPWLSVVAQLGCGFAALGNMRVSRRPGGPVCGSCRSELLPANGPGNMPPGPEPAEI